VPVERVVVASWNLWGGSAPGTYTRDRGIARGALPGSPAALELDPARTWSRRLPLLVAELEALRPDAVALQENARSDNDESHAAELASRLGMHVCEEDHEHRVALLTRRPIRSARPLELVADTYGYPLPLLVEVDGAAETLTVVVIHLPLARCGDRTALVSELGRALADLEPPLLACGDLNAEAGDPHVSMLLAAGLVDATVDAGPTMPNPDPQVRLDYVLVGSGRASTTVRSAITLGQRADEEGFLASDHLGVAVDLDF
jgi:endonuclease/exonuclease/phosphatase family metal-dependent hydrolase